MKRLQLLVLSVLCFSAGLQSQELRVEDGYCLISSPEEMEVFAQRVNGGESSLNGRLTAPLCVAGGIFLQALEAEGITVRARILEIGGNTEDPRGEIEKAMAEKDSPLCRPVMMQSYKNSAYSPPMD